MSIIMREHHEVNNICYQKMQGVEDTIGRAMFYMHPEDKSYVALDEALVLIHEYKEYLESTEDEYRYTIKEALIRYMNENTALKAENDALKAVIKDMRDVLVTANRAEEREQELVELVSNTQKIARVLAANIVEYNGRIDAAVGVIAAKEVIVNKPKLTGKEAPAYKETGVSDDNIISLYKSGKSIKEIAEAIGLTENGLRVRLKKAGVFEDRRRRKNKTST